MLLVLVIPKEDAYLEGCDKLGVLGVVVLVVDVDETFLCLKLGLETRLALAEFVMNPGLAVDGGCWISAGLGAFEFLATLGREDDFAVVVAPVVVVVVAAAAVDPKSPSPGLFGVIGVRGFIGVLFADAMDDDATEFLGELLKDFSFSSVFLRFNCVGCGRFLAW